MIALYKIKNYLGEKLKVAKHSSKEKKLQRERANMQQEHDQYMREKRIACDRIIESIKNTFIFYERDDDSAIFIDDNAKKRCIDELIKYRDSDSITHMIHQTEISDVVISNYFSFYQKRVGFMTQYFDLITGESYVEEYYSPDTVLLDFLKAIHYFDEEKSTKKNTL